MNHWIEDIYLDHRRGLFGLAMSVVREAALAEDAVHDAFARMARQPGPPSGDATAYAYRAVRNAAIDQARRRQTRPMLDPDAASLFAATQASDPGIAAQISETQQMLMQAVDNLPAPERETIIMRSFGGLTFKQIAQATDEPLTTIASRYQKALKMLRERMEKHHAGA